jgi:hypothetical protein
MSAADVAIPIGIEVIGGKFYDAGEAGVYQKRPIAIRIDFATKGLSIPRVASLPLESVARDSQRHYRCSAALSLRWYQCYPVAIEIPC